MSIFPHISLHHCGYEGDDFLFHFDVAFPCVFFLTNTPVFRILQTDCFFIVIFSVIPTMYGISAPPTDTPVGCTGASDCGMGRLCSDYRCIGLFFLGGGEASDLHQFVLHLFFM